MPVEVELDIFSGRPNPKWMLEPGLEVELLKKINSLALDPRGSFPEPPGLGYRGFLLKIGNGPSEDRAGIYQGVVKINDEVRKDPSHTLEKWLLETAPIDKQLLEAIKDQLF